MPPTKADIQTLLNTANAEIVSLKAKLEKVSSAPVKEKKPKVKRAPGAYALFVKAQFAGTKEENPGKTAPEIMKLISGKWKLDKAEKAKTA